MQPLIDGLIYIVDDDASVREALAWLLRSRHLLSESYGSAEEFEAMLQRGFAQSQPVENSPMLVTILPESGEPDETFRLRARRNRRCLDSSSGSALTRCRL